MTPRSGLSAMHEGDTSSPSGVHFETGVFTESFDVDQLLLPDTELLKLFSLFSPTIPASLPHGADTGLDLVSRGASAERSSQISSFLGVEA